MVGGPTALGGQVTQEFVERVEQEGFSEYGRLYAEFVQQQLRGVDLDRTRVVLQGASKGAITSDQTVKYLPDNLRERKVKTVGSDGREREITRGVQLLHDNPAGIQGDNLPTQVGRSINMGVGMAAEVGIRMVAGSVKGGAFTGQKDLREWWT
jgi:hypothetical protein